MLKPQRRKYNSLAQILTITGVIILAAVILLLKDQNILPRAASSGESPKTQLENALIEHRPILAFYHSWNCIPCKEMTAIVARVYPEFEDNIVLIDIDVYDRHNAALLQEAGIHAIPTLVIYNHQGDEQTLIGVIEADRLRQMLANLADVE